MDIKIRFLQKSEEEKLLDFNRDNYGPSHILTDPKYIHWQFGEFPLANNNFSILGVFSGGGSLIGVFGMTVLKFNYFNAKINCTSLANLIVKKDLRNFGLGYLLLREAEKISPLACDHGLNEDAMKLFTGRGWRGFNLNRYVFIYNVSSIKKFDGLKDLKITNSEALENLDYENKYSDNFKKIDSFDNRLNVFFNSENMLKKYPLSVERSEAYLNWRYFKHPLINYEIFILTSENLIKSFAVIRREGGGEFPVARIIDFISFDETEKFFLESLINYFKNQNIYFIDYFFSGDYHLNSLQKLGFVNCNKNYYKYLPNRFNPLDLKGKNFINFVFKVNNKPRVDSKKWYTTKGGGDQDRAY
ncbi:MAG: hypothetical protein Q8Q23_04575 [bacterium]|nr:hypothetical protein [bacterium]